MFLHPPSLVISKILIKEKLNSGKSSQFPVPPNSELALTISQETYDNIQIVIDICHIVLFTKGCFQKFSREQLHFRKIFIDFICRYL